jgi:hypothetical protein
LHNKEIGSDITAKSSHYCQNGKHKTHSAAKMLGILLADSGNDKDDAEDSKNAESDRDNDFYTSMFQFSELNAELNCI